MLRNGQRGIANLSLKENHLKVTMDTRQALMSAVADEEVSESDDQAGSTVSISWNELNLWSVSMIFEKWILRFKLYVWTMFEKEKVDLAKNDKQWIWRAVIIKK